MYSRGYLTWDSAGPAINSLPAIQTSNGLAYRKFDMNMQFRDRNIWTKPEEVKPNSYIDAGPIWNANLVCPHGNFTVKGDLRGARIFVPNGTLTVEGGILSSFIAARQIIVEGAVTDSAESGTTIGNAGPVDARSRIIKIAARSPIVEFIPPSFRPATFEERSQERRRQHDAWLHGQAYRKWEKEHIPGVILPPNPPEPPK